MFAVLLLAGCYQSMTPEQAGTVARACLDAGLEVDTRGDRVTCWKRLGGLP